MLRMLVPVSHVNQPLVAGLVGLILLAAPVHDVVLAGKFNRQLSPGDDAPDWRGLVGTDDQEHALADEADAALLVQVFTSNHCPVARAYEERLIQLARDFEEQGVRFVAINSSSPDLDSESLSAMKDRAEASHYPFPYLRDAKQTCARSHGATCTPTVFVLKPAGDPKPPAEHDDEAAEPRATRFTVVYLGAIDDQWRDAAKVKRHYLREALEALLDGRDPKFHETRPSGCEIEFQE